ncbi:MAG: repeat-associated core protein [Bacteroidetes bacterium]|nr:repeat-associated core protein [Bacteroidota bacterium]
MGALDLATVGRASQVRSLITSGGELIAKGGRYLYGKFAVAEGVAAKGGGNLWKVGAYNELQGLESGLQAHHVGQKRLMGKMVSGYNPANAPSKLVPEIGHVTNMPGIGRVAATRGLGGFTNARQVLARDIFEFRRVYGGQGLPNSSLQQLIQMNKTMYPRAFIK